MNLHIEVRPGEGGSDARLLMEDQSRIYLRYAERHSVAATIAEATQS